MTHSRFKSTLTAAVLACATLAAGCGSLTHKKDEVALGKVRKVAVVAFTADEPAAATLGLNLNSGKTEAGAGGSMISKNSETVDQMLISLSNAIGRSGQWKMLSTVEMTKNAGYKDAFHRTMDGWQNKMPPGSGQNRFLAKQVMDYDAARILGKEGREKLMRDLSVDAIVAAQVNVVLSGTTVMGFGPRHPQANLSFSVYETGIEAPVWFEGKIAGPETEESVGATHFTDEGATARLALKSAMAAFDKIGSSSVN